MRLSVIGCGYLGAVHAACMAELGHDVVGIDVDPTKVAALNLAQPTLYEPGLVEILQRNLTNGRLRFTTDFAAAADAQVHFLGVGTPQKRGEQAADLSYVYAAVDSLAPYVAPGALIAGKSTVPVGTAASVEARLKQVQPEAMLAWNPEFLREGVAVSDTISPDRIVYGLPAGPDGEKARALLDQVYSQALSAGTPLVATDFATAELVKVAANAFLATKISFINAMSEVAAATGADVTKLADAIGYDERIGRKFLNAGAGFGGGCLPKDIRAFRARAEELGLGDTLTFLKEVESINLRQRVRISELVVEALDGHLMGHRVAVLGLAFKPESDDVRDSPALDVAVRLHGLGADVVCADPKAIANAAALHPQLSYTEEVTDAIDGAEVLVLLTEWKQYRELDPALAATKVRGRIVIDGRNVLDPEAWRRAGWRYYGVGRN
ncbi:MAG: UDP-glucose/GDP-mannose dehydrogenase family protein [Propionibacteriales bacterium]|nr:UDP-glucose/GDP-mannose dehydrogenase family protein [Propionibacteriales bacterium]